MSEHAPIVDPEYMASLIATAAYVAWSNTLSFPRSEQGDRYFRRMKAPVAGDLVVEITNWQAKPLDRVGRLVSVKDEPPPYMDENTYDPAKYEELPWPPYLEKVWRITTLDGREYYWWNADFRVVPEDPFRHQAAIGAAEPKGETP